MSEEKGSYVWVVVPRGWGYDDNNYNAEGYDLPSDCFTFPEMAEEWVKENNIKRFRDVATDNYFSGYVDFNSVIWQYLRESNPKAKSHSFTEEMISKAEKGFCKDWNINPNNFSFDQDDLDRMSDEKILELMKLLELTFYTVARVKIMC